MIDYLAERTVALATSWARQLGAMLLSPESKYSIAAIAIVLAIAVAATLSGRRNGRNVHVRALARAIFPRRLFRSPSGKADIAFSFFNIFPAPMLFGWGILSVTLVEQAVRSLLAAGLGIPEAATLPIAFSIAAMTVAAYLAFEFGYWLDHYLMHRIPFLWSFHKVHHSAESLSPLTNFRMHPVDSIIFYNILALTVGTTEAVVGHALAAPAVHGANVLLLAAGIGLVHLQHSHLWISFSGRLGRFLLSPAHHQIHHSTNPIHFNRNFGSSLAIWDLLFGTLHVPARKRETLTFGLDDLGYDPHSAKGSLAMPFADAWSEIRPGRTISAEPSPLYDLLAPRPVADR